MKSDFTIYMDEPIVREGGVVIIQPEAVDLEGDQLAELTSGTNKLTISSQVTIVRLQYPQDGTYVYRFDTANPQNFPGTNGQTRQIGVGSSWDYHPDDRDRSEEIPAFLTHHFQIPGGNWTEEQSRERQVNLPGG
ncbi:hypothetical protein ACG74X_21250, partial [Marivita sp. S0852]|uniref:hypothetical protein n=1 Tax=Marivita sp. S0852 TaxID=3373893 RepID=UPI003981B423